MGDNNNNNNNNNNNDDEVSRRVNRGKQRVEMVRMENESNLQVTFSKRRAGLFKKASELCTLCAAEMALIVFSPGNKVFSFGHPSVDSVLSSFAGERRPVPAGLAGLVEAYRAATLRDLNQQLARVTSDMEAERRKWDEIGRLRREAVYGAGEWCQGPIDGIRCQARLKRLGQALRQLKMAVTAQTDRIVMHTTHAANAASLNLNTAPFPYNNTNDNMNVVAVIAPTPSLPPFITSDNNNNQIEFGNNGGHGFY